MRFTKRDKFYKTYILISKEGKSLFDWRSVKFARFLKLFLVSLSFCGALHEQQGRKATTQYSFHNHCSFTCLLTSKLFECHVTNWSCLRVACAQDRCTSRTWSAVTPTTASTTPATRSTGPCESTRSEATNASSPRSNVSSKLTSRTHRCALSVVRG